MRGLGRIAEGLKIRRTSVLGGSTPPPGTMMYQRLLPRIHICLCRQHPRDTSSRSKNVHNLRCWKTSTPLDPHKHWSFSFQSLALEKCSFLTRWGALDLYRVLALSVRDRLKPCYLVHSGRALTWNSNCPVSPITFRVCLIAYWRSAPRISK